MFNENDAQAFSRLGLTGTQTKVYLVLAKVGQATIKTIAQNTKIARQDIYRIMATLQDLGLAEKMILAKATEYKATPIEEGLSILLQNKKVEYIELKKQAKTIANNFYENKGQNISSENVQFIISSEITLLLKTLEKLSDMTRNSIDATIPLKLTEKMLFEFYPYLKRTAKRGVKIRFITQKADEESMLRNPKPLSKNSLFELRYVPECSNSFGMHIFDEKEVTLALSENAMPSLRTNSVHVVLLAKAYFESLWGSAQI